MSVLEKSFLSPAASGRTDRTQNDQAVSRPGNEKQEKTSFSQYFDKELQKKSEPVSAQKKPDSQSDKKPDSLADTSVQVEEQQTEIILSFLEAETDDLLSGNFMPPEEVAEASNDSLLLSEIPAEDNLLALVVPVVGVSEGPEGDANAMPVEGSETVPEEFDLDTVTTKLKSETTSADRVVNIETDQNDLIKSVKVVSAQSPSATMSVAENSTRVPEQSQQMSIQTPVNNARWGNDLSQRVSLLIQTDNQQVAKIQLNPEQLGPVGVRIQIEDDQARISFVTSQPAVKEAIEASLPKLREMLQEQGLNLADVDVSAQNSQDDENFSEESHARDHSAAEQITEQTDGLSQVQVEVSQGLSVFV